MGKVKRVKRKERDQHLMAFADELKAAELAKPTKVRDQPQEEPASNQYVIDEKSSRKILQTARKQQEELESEFGLKPDPQKKYIKKQSQSQEEDAGSDADSDWEGIPDFEEKITAEDEQSMAAFIQQPVGGRRTLYDAIMQRLEEKRAEIEEVTTVDGSNAGGKKLDPKVAEVYQGVAEVLCRYRSGKLPKAFKVLPVLVDWEELTFLTRPHQWTAAAMYQAVRRFASTGTERICQRFYNLIFLPRMRDDITEYKKVNFYLYMSLKKALYKPAAFFKGFLLPLCEGGDCTLREAVIISSVIAKCSIPVLHASAAMLKIAEMNYSGANSIFLKTFFDKKYSLPFRVIDATVYHFLSFMKDDREFPVLWHQCLLCFVQRYKHNLSQEQKTELIKLASKHFHHKISPNVHRELQHSLNKFEGTEMTAGAQMETDT